MTDASAFKVTAFNTPKEGNAMTEYEDAWSIKETPDGYRLAIADGATESSFSQLWASLLVTAYTRSKHVGPEFFHSLGPARRLWRSHVARRSLPWYAKEKADLGAYAAFLGLYVDDESRRWYSVAVGDCCLFQIDGRRGQGLVDAFPLSQSEDFGFSPYLIGTGADDVDPHIRISYGSLRPDDSIFLASDALSAWLLKRAEKGYPVWDVMSDIQDQNQFDAVVEAARESGLHNDDTTLVRMSFTG